MMLQSENLGEQLHMLKREESSPDLSNQHYISALADVHLHKNQFVHCENFYVTMATSIARCK